MPHFTFPTAELTAEHKRSPVRDVVLQVEVPENQSDLQVSGELAVDLLNMENRLRLGQMAELKLTATDGRFTRLSVLLIELKGIEAPAPKQRVYRWAFLVPVKPGHDPQGMFRRPGEPVPEPPRPPTPTSLRPATLKDDPNAQEISLGELLTQMGADAFSNEVKFTSEGGFVAG
jgi:hypothetical protein